MPEKHLRLELKIFIILRTCSGLIRSGEISLGCFQVKERSHVKKKVGKIKGKLRWTWQSVDFAPLAAALASW